MGLIDAFRGLKRVITGEVIQQIDTEINGGYTTMSLRLKREARTGDYYVALAGLSSGNYQYFSFSRDEFDQFAEAINTIQTSLKQTPGTTTM